LQGLAKRLAESAQQVPVDREEIYDQIHSIALEDVCYQHPSQEKRSGFMLGPINYQFDSGKVYFIRGNNGSGKTTLMRILIGLYQPSSGRILVNGHPISEPTTGAYRDMFAVVFSDFHLFKTLYGLPADDVRRLEDLLKVFRWRERSAFKMDSSAPCSFQLGSASVWH